MQGTARADADHKGLALCAGVREYRVAGRCKVPSGLQASRVRACVSPRLRVLAGSHSCSALHSRSAPGRSCKQGKGAGESDIKPGAGRHRRRRRFERRRNCTRCCSRISCGLRASAAAHPKRKPAREANAATSHNIFARAWAWHELGWIRGHCIAASAAKLCWLPWSCCSGGGTTLAEGQTLARAPRYRDWMVWLWHEHGMME